MRYFVRRLYHEEKLGPFATVADARDFIAAQEAKEPGWGYDAPSVGEWDKYPEALDRSEWQA